MPETGEKGTDIVNGAQHVENVPETVSDTVVITEEDIRLVTYTVEDTPPWPLCILLGFQHYLTAFGSTLAVPLVLAGPLCLSGDDVGLSEIIGTTFFVGGIATLLQTTFGIRLPIIQGVTFAFLAPTFSILSLPEWQCPSRIIVHANTTSTNITATQSSVFLVMAANGTTHLAELGSDEHREVWQARLREVQGAIMVASLSQIILGFSGLFSVVLRYIGPLVVAPTVALVGLALFDAAADKASQLWWIAFMTVVLIVVFSQCLHKVSVPLPTVSITRKHGCQCSAKHLPIFGLFPVLLAMALSWLLCLVLTLTNALPDDPDHWAYNARTDTRSAAITNAPWFRVPYPGQWGVPTVSVSAVLGMLAGVLASMIESVGDYYACARLSCAPPPPSHALNRGIGVEGIGCVIAGAFGSGNGTTSYSENVAAIGITKVASRRVVQTAGVLLVVLGCLGKVGALFVTIPDPVAGGMFLAMFGMVTAVGLSNLRFVDMRTPRNMCVLGLSLFIGLTLPRWISAHKEAIDTGSSIADQIIEVLLSTSMFVGGFIGFVLDNSLPGTDEERGLTLWRRESGRGREGGEGGWSGLDVYSLSIFNACINRLPALGRLPFCPAARTRTPPQDSEQCTSFA
ncbi:solute carrier family 23 member 1-like [Littorina saxatilis]|uniref:Solute carrier family 23 member 2 n=1 Tax=Littorina saxatilis TaxID=31220 RepID=A0AAN9BQE7_9CAEN